MNKAHEIPLKDVLEKLKRIQDLEFSVDLAPDEKFIFQTRDTVGSKTVIFDRSYLISAAIGYKNLLNEQERHKKFMDDILTSRKPSASQTPKTS